MEILLYDEIWQGTAAALIDELKTADDVTLRINSSGGDVFEALAIYNYLAGRKAEVIIDGICASAATIVAMAGAEIIMNPSALMMIHNPSIMLFDRYNAQDLEALKVTLEKVTASIEAVYRKRVPNYEMPEKEQWLTANEAKELGFVDEVLQTAPQMTMLLTGGKIKKFAAQVTNKIDKTIMDNINSGAGTIQGAIQIKDETLRVKMLADFLRRNYHVR